MSHFRYLWNRLRLFLIQLLAGDSAVVMNVTIHGARRNCHGAIEFDKTGLIQNVIIKLYEVKE